MMIPEVKFEKLNSEQNIVYLGEENAQFKSLPLNKDEYDYMISGFEKKQKFIFINRYKYQYIIIKTDSIKDSYLLKEEVRNCGNKAVSALKKNNIPVTGVQYLGENKELVYSFIEGILLGNYRFIKYIKEEDKYSLDQITIDPSGVDKNEIKNLLNLTKAVSIARDLINEPVNHLNAVKLADELKKMADSAGVKIEVFEKKKIEALRMGGLLAVNKGSIDPPTFSILEWKPENAVNKKPVILIGKGLVYDTGGLSLKPTANSMDEMKCDMSGAAAVAGAMYAIALNKLPVYVVALVPSTDNRPGGNAYAPGDIITMHNGLTVEVMNTDAEGRLILADAISYSAHYKPKVIVTIATLTGSAQMAIGNNATVGMGNADKKIMKNLLNAGNEVHERVVQFPFWNEYAEELKSDCADLKNIGGRTAGAITAGKFLEKFASYPFLHLDIAGPAFLKKSNTYRPKGGTGVGVRLLYQFVKNMIN